MLYLNLERVSPGTVIQYDAAVIFKGETQRILTDATIVEIESAAKYTMTFADKPGYLIDREIIELGNSSNDIYDSDEDALLIIDETITGKYYQKQMTTMRLLNAGSNFDPCDVKINWRGNIYQIITKEIPVDTI